jgi:hypothetical protein
MRAARSTSDPDATSTPGAYLTDGRRLRRIVSPPDRSRRWRTAVLEDCGTLELREFRRRDLRRLRPVGSRRLALQRGVADTPAAMGTGPSPELQAPASGVLPETAQRRADARP